MTMELNFYASPLPFAPSKHDYQNQELHPFVPNNQVFSSSSSSSSSSSCVFFDTIQDQTGRYRRQLYPLQLHQDHNHACNGGSSMAYEVEWKNEDLGDVPPEIKWKNDANPVKPMSSKMRQMQKMKKNHDGLGLNLTSYCTTKKSSYLGTDSRNNISSSHDNIPIRVCSDCNTTKTPLWRSGPKGPKSLCNACGIKLRKARRAAMAAAAAKGSVVPSDKPQAPVTIKMQHEEKGAGEIPEAPRLMERSKMKRSAAGSKSNAGQKKLGSFEDSLSKNLKFHRVLPEDEMDAAILLMALSSGLLHG